MKNNVSIFIPARSGSERVKDKNTRDFAGVSGGLIYLKLKTALEIDGVDEVVFSTNDEKAIEIAKKFKDPKLRIDIRPNELCVTSTPAPDLFAYVPKIISNDHIFWIHVTSPFITKDTYESALKEYFINLNNKSYDSMLSVTKIQQFIWDDKLHEMINCDIIKGNWPRTQDLKPLFEVNHAFYIGSRKNYLTEKKPISNNLAIYVLDKLSSIDIDWEDDFLLAESIYKGIYQKV